jgi:hypothetical protein
MSALKVGRVVPAIEDARPGMRAAILVGALTLVALVPGTTAHAAFTFTLTTHPAISTCGNLDLTANEANVLVAAFRITRTGGGGGTYTGLTITEGDGPPGALANAFDLIGEVVASGAKLWYSTSATWSCLASPTETLLASGSFAGTAPNRSVAFSFTGQGTAGYLYVTLSAAASVTHNRAIHLEARTLALGLAGGAGDGSAYPVAGDDGASFVTSNQSLTLTAYNAISGCGNLGMAVSESSVLVAAFRISAAGPVTYTGLRVYEGDGAPGALDNTFDLIAEVVASGAKLWFDTDGSWSCTSSPTETSLASGSFVGTEPNRYVDFSFASQGTSGYFYVTLDAAASLSLGRVIHLETRSGALTTTSVDSTAYPVAGDNGAAFVATIAVVYYSVGTSRLTDTDLKSGSPTVDITNGIATFSEAQPNNIGVGDEINYGSSTVAYISGRSSSTTYPVITAVGATPSNVTGATVNSIKRAFGSLTAANSGSADASHLNIAGPPPYSLVAANVQLNWPCYNDATMDDRPAVNNWTTGPASYIRIYVPYLATEVGARQRHTGVAGTGFRLRFSGTGPGALLLVQEEYVRVEGVEIDGSLIDDAVMGIYAPNTLATTSEIHVDGCIIHDLRNTTTAGWHGGIIAFGGTGTGAKMMISNNIIYDLYSEDLHVVGITVSSDPTSYIYNNTVYRVRQNSNPTTGAAWGIAAMGAAATSFATNNFAADVTAASDPVHVCYSGWNSGTLNQTNNVSSDNTGTIINQTNYASYFVSVTDNSEDMHLQDKSNALWGSFGTNLTTDPNLPVKKDIDAVWRNALEPDMGADQYMPATAVRLAWFTASSRDRAAEVAWETASELDNLGFHLYRGLSENGLWQRLTVSLIPGLGSSPEGKRYSFLDAGLTNGTTYFYRLEDVDRSGKVTSHGPVSATPLADAGSAGEGEGTSAGDGDRSDGDGEESLSGWVVHGDPSDVSLRVLRRAGRGMTLELRTGGFYSLTQADGSTRLVIPGFFDLAEAGYPTLPAHRSWTDAIVGRGVRIGSVRARDLLAFDGLVPPVAGAPQASTTRDGTYRAGLRRVRAAALGRGLYPAAQARVLETAFQEESKKAYLELVPLRLDAARGQLVLARRLLVTVVFDGAVQGESGSGSRGRRVRQGRRPGESERLLARFATRAKGLYAVPWEEIGLVVADTAALRLSRQGVAVPFHVEPRPERFVPGSTLYFLSEGQEAAYAREAVYELALAPGGLRMAVEAASRGGSASPGAPLGSLLSSRRFEANANYLPGLLEAPDLWLWGGFLGGTGVDFPFTVASLAAGEAKLRVDLQGGSDTETPQDHHVRVSIGGVEVAQAHWDGMKPFSFEAEVPRGVLVEGANTLRLDSEGANTSAVYLDRFVLDYPHALVAENGSLDGSAQADGVVEATGFSTGSVLLELSGPSPVWLGRSPDERIAFTAEAGRDYLAVAPNAFLRPEVRPATPSALRDAANQADWIVIAPQALLPATEPLVLQRQAQGLSARGVPLEELYDAFGFGEASPEAVRDFIAHAYHHWTAPAPRYVLLLGDASYDAKGFFSGTSRQDLLPTLFTRSSFLWTASDPSYAAVNGDDLLPDLAIGRLSAGSLTEAQAVVQKILDFESRAAGLSGKAVLVADNPDRAGDFEANLRDIASLISSRPVETILLTRLGTSTNTAVRNAFDSGASLVSYVGHGSQVLWANAYERVFRAPDVDLLKPQELQPLVLTMTCSNGYFISPWMNAISERLTLTPGKGAIAAFSPSGLSFDAAAHLYHRALVQELEAGAHHRIGDLVLAAQRHYLDTGAVPELLSIYHLFADPALTVMPSSR